MRGQKKGFTTFLLSRKKRRENLRKKNRQRWWDLSDRFLISQLRTHLLCSLLPTEISREIQQCFCVLFLWSAYVAMLKCVDKMFICRQMVHSVMKLMLIFSTNNLFQPLKLSWISIQVSWRESGSVGLSSPIQKQPLELMAAAAAADGTSQERRRRRFRRGERPTNGFLPSLDSREVS